MNLLLRFEAKALSILLVTLVLFSCNNGSKNKKSLDKEFANVMAIHDEVMPMMPTINRYIKDCKILLSDTIQKLNSEEATQIEALKNQLIDADNQMMDWMAQFRKPNEDNLEKAHQYLQEQLTSVSVMADAVKSSITNAEAILKK